MSIDSSSETAIFQRLVLPSEPAVSRDVARSLLSLEFAREDLDRMHALSETAKSGSLTPDESHELENYERVGHYLAILQSKARVALRGS